MKRVVGESQIMQMLLRHILGQEYTDSKLKESMLARGSPMPGVADELLASTRIFDKDLALFDSDSDGDSDIKDQLNELRRQAEVRRAKCDAIEKGREVVQRNMPPPSSASSSSPPSRPTRTFVPRPATGYSVEQAKAWLPPKCSISKDTEREQVAQTRLLPLLVGDGDGAKQKLRERRQDFGLRGDGVLHHDGMESLPRRPWRRQRLPGRLW